MKKCVVKDCESTDSGSSVLFYPFPENPHYKILWKSRIKACEFNKNSVVCGLHFKPEDYDAENRLRYDAIPQAARCSNSTQNHNEKEDCETGDEDVFEMTDSKIFKKEEVIPDDSTDLKACRACLAVDCKMFPLKNKKLKQAYNQVTGLRAPPTDGLPQLLCWECSSRLLSAARFRHRAKKAYDILSVLKCRHDSINMGAIRSVNRHRMKLSSQLSHEYDVHSDGNLKEIAKSDNFDDNAECDTDYECKDVKIIEIDSPMSPSGVEDCDNHCDVGSVISGDEMDKSEIDVKTDNNDILMTNDENRIEVDKSLSPLTTDVKIYVDVESIKNVARRKIKTNKNTLKNVKKVGRQKPKEVRKRCARKKPPKTDISKFFTTTNFTLADAIASIKSREHSSAYINAPFKCRLCYRGYLTEGPYEAHALKHTEKFGNFECMVCKIRCHTQRDLSYHSVVHRAKYSCLKCEYVTCTRTGAVEHIKTHDGAVYQCQQCPKSFEKKSSYIGHLRLKHACEFACDLCGHTFLNKKGMLMHRRRRHVLDNQTSMEGPFCEVCDVTFTSQRAYDTHLKMSSKHNKDNHGDLVNAYNSTKPRGQEGKRRRPYNPEPVDCEQCGETLDNMYAYINHFKKKHPSKIRTQLVAGDKNKPVVCEFCGKTFLTSTSLKSHMATHTGQYMVCDYCGKTATNKTNLTIHMRTHMTARPMFPCKACGKPYSHYTNMLRHFKSHTTPAPYQCDICGKHMTTLAGVKHHINHVHNGIPRPKRKRTRTTDKTEP